MTGRLNAQILYLGTVKQGDEIRIKMQLKQDDVMSGVVRVTAAYLDETVMADIYGAMEEQRFRLTKGGSFHVEGTISMKRKGSYFFPRFHMKRVECFDRWKKRQKQLLWGDAFLAWRHPGGNHKIYS